MIRIRCFGVAKEVTASEFIDIDLDVLSVAELREKIDANFVGFANVKGYMIAINQEYATDDMKVTSTDEVAIIPPVSGG